MALQQSSSFSQHLSSLSPSLLMHRTICCQEKERGFLDALLPYSSRQRLALPASRRGMRYARLLPRAALSCTHIQSTPSLSLCSPQPFFLFQFPRVGLLRDWARSWWNAIRLTACVLLHQRPYSILLFFFLLYFYVFLFFFFYSSTVL